MESEETFSPLMGKITKSIELSQIRRHLLPKLWHAMPVSAAQVAPRAFATVLLHLARGYGVAVQQASSRLAAGQQASSRPAAGQQQAASSSRPAAGQQQAGSRSAAGQPHMLKKGGDDPGCATVPGKKFIGFGGTESYRTLSP